MGVLKATSIKTVGLCHSVQVCVPELFEHLGIADQYDLNVNNQAFGQTSSISLAKSNITGSVRRVLKIPPIPMVSPIVCRNNPTDTTSNVRLC